MTNKLSLRERQEQVQELLRPDEIRRHRIAEGFEISEAQHQDLVAKGKIAGMFSRAMSGLSNAALMLDSLDPESRLTRSLLGTEPLFQARKRGEVGTTPLNEASITKVDLLMTPNGFSIVEIEPGKVRGLGYGRLVREQASVPVGLGTEHSIASMTQGDETMIALSDHDRFHIPELSILGHFAINLTIVNQHDVISSEAPKSVLVSQFKGSMSNSIEKAIREKTTIVSDRRPDIESKGNLALVHNTGENEALEERLLMAFTDKELEAVRNATPKTHHTRILSEQQRQRLAEDAIAGRVDLFAKPLNDSGTRGIITPSKTAELESILSRPRHSNAFALQEAATIVPQKIESIDVLTGEHGSHNMNVRVTIHVDRDGNIIEASVVGSPHEHLAHGGKTSVITNLEVSQ